MTPEEAREIVEGWTEEERKKWNKTANEDIVDVMKVKFILYCRQRGYRPHSPQAKRLLEIFEALFARLDELSLVEKITYYGRTREYDDDLGEWKSILELTDAGKDKIFNEGIRAWEEGEKRIKEEKQYLKIKSYYMRHKRDPRYKHKTSHGPIYTDGKEKSTIGRTKRYRKESEKYKIRF
tara:strand:+ start:112 stop:651 length:540 start_codon:yes stop_codon:yes gene_type:complete